MSWRILTREDLAARISEDELNAYADISGFGDSVTYLLEQTADEIRGHIASNRSAVLSETEHAIPSMLIGPACDLAVFAVLKRLELGISEPRQKAYDYAHELLQKISAGEITPEPGASTATSTVAAPAINVKPAIL